MNEEEERGIVLLVERNDARGQASLVLVQERDA